jgi:hypothetical protein
MLVQGNRASDTVLSANAAPQAGFRVNVAVSGQNVLLDDTDSTVRTIEEAVLAPGATRSLNLGLPRFLFFALLGRAVSFGIDDGPKGAGAKTGSAVGTEKWVYVKANFNFPLNGMFRAFFGTCAAPFAIATDLMSHKMSNPGGMRCGGTDLI